MNDDMMFEYLLNMGAMRPDQEELRRKQAIVDALRQGALDPMQGQMVGGHYVGGGLAGVASKLGQAYMAKQGQAGVDTALKGMNERQRQMLEEMRKRRRQQLPGAAVSTPGAYVDPYAPFTYGSEA